MPYLIMLVLCGMPMFYMELAVGQYFSLGPIGTWGAVCPLFQGNESESSLEVLKVQIQIIIMGFVPSPLFLYPNPDLKHSEELDSS